jgi:hypothetical protein
MGTSAQYIATPKNWSGQASVANSNRDGTGTLATVGVAGANAHRIDVLNLTAVGSTTPGMVRLYLDVGGSVRMIREVTVPTCTPSATNPAWSQDVIFDPPLIVQAAATLKASTEKAETINLTETNGGDF